MAEALSKEIRDLPRQPMLLPYLFHFRSGDGAVLILAPGRTYQFRLPGTLARVMERALECLDGQSTVAQLIESVRADVPDCLPEMVIVVLQYLDKNKLLVDGAARIPDGLSQDSIARWKRNLSFFSAFERDSRTRYDYQAALQEATVGLIGLGGTGSWMAYNLATAGVGKIVGVDGDRVEISNLNRQVLYRPQDVGRLKAEAAAEMLGAMAPQMKFTGLTRWVQSQEDVAEVIEGCDLVLLAADNPMGLINRWANAACFARRIPLIVSGIASRLATIGPLFVPGLTGCWECVDARKRRQSRHYAEMFSVLADHRAAMPPSLAPMCSLVGGQVAYEAIKYLTGFARPAALGCELVVDTVMMQTKRNPVRRQAGCSVCGGSAGQMPRHAARIPQVSGGIISRLFGRGG